MLMTSTAQRCPHVHVGARPHRLIALNRQRCIMDHLEIARMLLVAIEGALFVVHHFEPHRAGCVGERLAHMRSLDEHLSDGP